MNSFQRFENVLRQEPVDRALNFDILMTFAAHYVKKPLAEYYQNFRVLCAANFAVAEDFKIDILQAISDPFREAADLGAAISFPEDGLPVCTEPLLKELPDLKRLKLVAPESGRRMSDRIYAIEYFCAKSGGEIPVMGWVEGALAEAADLRGMNQLMFDLYENESWVTELLEFCTAQAIQFAAAQIEAGADIIGLGDAVCSQISAPMFAKFGLPFEQQIFKTVREMGAVPRLHICGDTTHFFPYMLHSGAEIIDLDWMVDLATAAQFAGDRVILCGNFDPVQILLRGTPEAVAQATTDGLKSGGKRYISAAGCEVPDGTPPANLLAQHFALKAAGPTILPNPL
jgi:uroporphyrinogen decarboxylase